MAEFMRPTKHINGKFTPTRSDDTRLPLNVSHALRWAVLAQRMRAEPEGRIAHRATQQQKVLAELLLNTLRAMHMAGMNHAVMRQLCDVGVAAIEPKPGEEIMRTVEVNAKAPIFIDTEKMDAMLRGEKLRWGQRMAKTSDGRSFSNAFTAWRRPYYVSHPWPWAAPLKPDFRVSVPIEGAPQGWMQFIRHRDACLTPGTEPGTLDARKMTKDERTVFSIAVRAAAHAETYGTEPEGWRTIMPPGADLLLYTNPHILHAYEQALKAARGDSEKESEP